MTSPTDDLIKELAAQSAAPRPMRSPARTVSLLSGLLLVYTVGVQCIPGLRADLGVQMGNPLFVTELVLLLCVIASSIVGSVFSLYPDAYQKPWVLTLPFWSLALLVTFMMGQTLFMPGVMNGHIDMEGAVCTQCIAIITIIPSFLIFWLLKGGASARPFSSGFYAVLTSAGIGCLVIRLEEVNNSLIHMAAWHYAPTLVFAALGAILGKIILKW